MRFHNSAILTLSVLWMGVSCRNIPKGAHSLGHGFWIQSYSQKSEGWEAVTFHSSFGHQNTTLCKNLGHQFISPSGNYAIYQDGPTGLLFLFSASTTRVTRLTNTFPGLPKEIIWQELQSKATLTFSSNQPPQTFALNQ